MSAGDGTPCTISATNTLLAAFELSSEPVTFAPARAPPQAELAWDEAS